MIPIFHHPFSLIMASPSNGGKSTLAYNIIKNSQTLVTNTNGKGFDSVWVLYRSYQPMYDQMKRELKIPVYLCEKTLHSDDLGSLLQKAQSKYPIVLIDDGLCPENQELVKDLFCRLGHHLSVSTILIGQTLFDANPTLRICHRNTKAVIVFACPRDQGSLRTLIYQMVPDRTKAKLLLETVVKELEKPYNYVMFDFQPLCPVSQRYKTNILCENELHPIMLTYRGLISHL
jgi:hypothetical protein